MTANKIKKTHNLRIKIKSSSGFGQKLHLVLSYLGILIGIVSVIYIAYIILPDFIRFLFNSLIKIIKMDYPNL
jgi:hypothetical protein